MSKHKKILWSDDIGLSVYKSADHCHFRWVFLVEADVRVWLFFYEFVYRDSFKVRMFLWDLEGKKLEAEEDAFFEEVDRIRRGEAWRKSALER